jgi:probable F420-dependent oxidoreductase
MFVETLFTPRPDEAAALARQVEALGFDSFALFETRHSPFLPLTLAAEHTRRIRLATGIALAFPLSPTTMAGLAWDLQGFSDGRFELGLGTQVRGHIERRFGVPWAAPGPRLRDYVGALRAIWESWATGRRLNYRSEHYNLTLMTPYFVPEPIAHPNIPVSIAAVGPYLLRLAGEVCDGVRLHRFGTPKYFAEIAVPAVEEGLKRAGRSRRDFTIYGSCLIATGATPAEVAAAAEEARYQVAFYGSTRAYHPVLSVHGWQALGEELHELSLRGAWDEMTRRVPDAVLEEFAVIGTYDQIAGILRRRYAELVDAINFALPPSALTHATELRALVAGIHSS